MSWNYSFPYNRNIIKCMRIRLSNVPAIDVLETGPDILSKLHQTCVIWLTDNLQRGRDYEYSNLDNVVIEYIYFDKEEDLLAFRLACGI